jgi:hypothetical protein
MLPCCAVLFLFTFPEIECIVYLQIFLSSHWTVVEENPSVMIVDQEPKYLEP